MPKKTEKGDSLVSPGTVCYAENKQEKPFWFSLLGKMVRFDTIILRRTILVNSCGLEKVTIIVAFHFMKRRLKKLDTRQRQFTGLNRADTREEDVVRD